MHVIYKNDEHYILGKVGHYLLHDKMTEVNLNFTQDICYQSMFYLQDSLESGKPEGLKVFGNWKTIYPALQSLPKKLKVVVNIPYSAKSYSINYVSVSNNLKNS